VAPLLLFMMGEISIISPIVNLLILVFVPFTMFFGFLSIIFSYLNFYIFDIFSSFFAFLSYIFLHYDILMTSFFSSFKYATFKTEGFQVYFMFLIYFIYFLFFNFYKKNKKNVKI
jgi:competence protein ComEC